MSIATEITRINNAKDSIRSAIISKGVEVPADDHIDTYADKIAQIDTAKYPELSDDNLKEPLTIIFYDANRTLTIKKIGSPDAKVFYYSFDKITWTPIDMTDQTTVDIAGSSTTYTKIYLKGEGTNLNKSTNDYYRILCSSSYAFMVSGNIMSLLGDDWYTNKTITESHCFCNLFYHCSVYDATMLALPATTIAAGAYRRMFYNCPNLFHAMSCLPCETVNNDAYKQMFGYCYKLSILPKMFATSINSSALVEYARECHCLSSVDFGDITSSEGSYELYGCLYQSKNLTKTILPNVNTLHYQTYFRLFKGCENLSYVKCLATDISANQCVTEMMSGVASTGTFVCAVGMTQTWKDSTALIPEGWTFVEVDE